MASPPPFLSRPLPIKADQPESIPTLPAFAPTQSLTHQALRAISKDVIKLTRSPPEEVRVRVLEGDIGSGVVGIIRGPGACDVRIMVISTFCSSLELVYVCYVDGTDGTPYAGGYYNVSFSFAGIDYPNLPPKCKPRLRNPNQLTYVY